MPNRKSLLVIDGGTRTAQKAKRELEKLGFKVEIADSLATATVLLVANGGFSKVLVGRGFRIPPQQAVGFVDMVVRFLHTPISDLTAFCRRQQKLSLLSVLKKAA